jgi:hypothetical protein
MVRIVIGGRRMRVRFIPGKHYLRMNGHTERGDVVITDRGIVIGAARDTPEAARHLANTIIYLKRHPAHVLN